MTELFLGPTYTSATVSDVVSGAVAALLIISHLPMVWAVAFAFYARHARLAVAGLTSLVVSITYHLCRAEIMCLGLPVNVLRTADHWAVLVLIGALGLHLCMSMLAPPRSQLFFVIVGYLNFSIAFLAVQFLPYTLLSGVIMLLFVLFVAVVRIALLGCQGDLCRAGPPPDSPEARKIDHRMTLLFVVGIAAAVVSLGFYFVGGSAPEGNTLADAVSFRFASPGSVF